MAATSPPGTGLLKGLGVTVKHLFRRPSTLMYPYERDDLAPRTRGVIALMDENCTVCMLCARECPDWCIYIESHKETVPPAKEGGRARTRNVLDRFAIDFSLCMYCGICVEVCPFDALWWSPEFEYSEYNMESLLHEMEKLREWADTVPAPPPLDDGAQPPAEVADAIEKAEKERELAEAKAAEEAQAKEQGADAGGAAPAAAKADEPKVEAGQIDQETYDQLIAEGKSERMARSKAKAAYVKKEKARLRAEAEGADATASEEAAATDESAAAADQEPSDDRAQTSDDAPAQETRKLGDVQVEGAGEIDQEVFDQLIAEGKSERIARSKAKAAWVKKRKQEQLDQEGDA